MNTKTLGVAMLALGCAGPTMAGTINVPADLPTISTAIVAAADGDEIAVAPGIYPETINFLGKAILIRATSGNPNATVIDGGGSGSVVLLINGEGPDSELRGFTITGGSTPFGGGLHVADTSPTVRSCVISYNLSSGIGAGIYVTGESATPLFDRCLLIGNVAGSAGGGGAAIDESGTATFVDCLFQWNESDGHGGAIFTDRAPAVLSRCFFNANEGWSDVSTSGGDIEITNSLFLNSQSSIAAVHTTGGTVGISNATFAKNVIPGLGVYGAGAITMSNSILRGLGPSDVLIDSGTIDIDYSNVRGGYAGVGNIDVVAGYMDFATTDLRLAPDSPCIDAASVAAALPGSGTVDLAGDPRIVDSPIVPDANDGPLDMGAYEAALPVRYVKSGATGLGNGSSWDDAYSELQDALTGAAATDTIAEIWIAAGSYRPDLGTGDRTATFDLVDGVDLYGGFAGIETLREERDPVAYNSKLTGEIGASGTADNSYHVVTASDLSSDTRLDGLIIIYGNASVHPNGGGGLRLINASPVIVACEFAYHESTTHGTAVSTSGGSPELHRCRVHSNVGNLSTVYFSGGSPRVTSTALWGNTATNGGAALYFANSEDAHALNTTVWSNHSGQWAAGIFVFDGTLTLANSISWGNTRDVIGGTSMSPNLHNTNGALIAHHNTIGSYFPSPLFDVDDDNTGEDPGFVDLDGPDDVAGTIDDDPALGPDSPSIDSGDNDFVTADMTLDLVGNARRIDDAGTVDTGNGRAPLVDRGAVETIGVPCAADLDGSADVGFSDLVSLLALWGTCDGCAADIDQDGNVGFNDLVMLLAAWGGCA